MSRFTKEYIKLLQAQVAVEIKYLSSMGHTRTGRNNSEPCIFCYMNDKEYRCGRMNDLLNFQSTLTVRERTSFGLPEHEYSPIEESSLIPFNPVQL